MSRAGASLRPPRQAPRWGSDRMATVVLGDDHVVFLDALSTVLSQHGHIVCGVARNAAEMVTLVSVHQPDACLIDHNAPGDEDAQTIRTVLAACAGTSVIVLGASSCSDTVGRALDAGATGYLHQSRGLGALVSALERVLDGEIVIDVPDASPPRRSAEPNLELRMHSRLEAASFAVRHRLPDLWSGDISAATVGAARPNVVRTPSLVQATSTVRPIRPRRVAAMRERATQQDLPVAAGQGVSAG